ncbi:MAG TPA: RES family NAD+ phosphorylase [Lactovum miscens]|uniref:RES family NAD+ phosphorylase n=1 Tax=Lactovum miscens TaxID=190387 RepID=UPI002ED93F74
MKFCSECFKYEEVRDMISSLDIKGNCDINDEHKNVYICDTEDNFETTKNIKNVLRQIIDIYTAEDELPSNFPDNRQDLLRHSLKNRWSLFNLDAQSIQYILDLFFKGDSDFEQKLLTNRVGVLEENNTLEDLLIIRNNNWKEFAESIKYSNRFHTKALNLKNLGYFLNFTSKVLQKSRSKHYFRCRVSNTVELKEKDLGAPPKDKATAGRLNPEWISVLYLSNSESSCVQEVRASFRDDVYIGSFSLNRDIKVVDLRNFENITLQADVDYLKYYLNRETLIKIAEDFAKPSNNDIKDINYLPLQYISEFIKSLVEAYDGILYKSTMGNDASNLVLFDETLAKCTCVVKKNVTEINYILG